MASMEQIEAVRKVLNSHYWTANLYPDSVIAAAIDAANATLVAAVKQTYEALAECDEAMGYMSEYDIPLCMPERTKKALAALRPFARGEDAKS